MLKGLWNTRGRRAARDPLAASLGSLERQVMDIVWQGGGFTVRDVCHRLTGAVAYTTAMTTLDRLYKKGLVSRARRGRAFVYTASQSRARLQADMASGIVTGLLSSATESTVPILSNLVDAVGRQDGGLELLTTLEGLVRDRRRQLALDHEPAIDVPKPNGEDQ